MIASAVSTFAQRLNRNSRRTGQPFDPVTSLAPPHGVRSSWAHYGVIVPNLPEPYRAFGVMSIVGTPGIAIFSNDHAITTSARHRVPGVGHRRHARRGTAHLVDRAGLRIQR